MTGTAPDDEELVRAAWRGDVSALGALLGRHRASLYATALGVLGDPNEAHDAVQDTFVTAVVRLHELRQPAAAAGWLRVVTRNHSLMRVRARRVIPTADLDARPSAEPDGADAIECLAVSDWVWTAIHRLPEDQAATVMLRYFSRHSTYHEIAAVLGVPIGTVRSRLSQAKDRLSEELLRAAARTHTDHRAVVDERARWWRSAADELHQRGVGHGYAADCAPDVLVAEHASGYRVRGIDDHRRGVEDSVAAGVRMQTTDVWATSAITIIEGNYLNPPNDPRHCPATHTEVRIHPDGKTTRLHLYYRPHANPVPGPGPLNSSPDQG